MKEEEKKKEEEHKRKQALKYYNNQVVTESKPARTNSESNQDFVSLKSQLENALVRKDNEDDRHVTSPASRANSNMATKVCFNNDYKV